MQEVWEKEEEKKKGGKRWRKEKTERENVRQTGTQKG